MHKYNKELFIHLILGVISLIIVHFLGGDKEIILLCVILAYILIASFTVWLKAKFASDKKQNLLLSFWTNDLLPNKEHTFLDFKTEIVFVEYESESSIYERYKSEFEKIEGLKPTLLSINPSREINVQQKLFGAESVVIIRSEGLEAHPQVYTEIESWASKNSQTPCLVIDKIEAEKHKTSELNPIPERYFFIPDDEKSLAWRLLQRANERAALWREQASFNRFTALTVGMILITIFTGIGFKLITDNRKKENFSALKQVYKNIATETKGYYEQTILKQGDPSISFSYWIKHKGKLYRLGTSEENSSYKSLDNNNKSVVGCSFANPNTFATNKIGDPNNSVIILPIELPDSGGREADCKFMVEDSRHISKIVCASYNKETENTVSLCVDSKNGQKLDSKESLEFLGNRTKIFFESISPRLINKDLDPEE